MLDGLKRKKNIGRNLSISYSEPLHMLEAKGQFFYDDQGRKYLDCVNNISHVGHSNKLVHDALVSQNLKLDELQLKITKSEGLPVVSGYFSHQQMAMRNSFNFFDTQKDWFPATLWGINVNIPIFNSGEGKAKTTQKNKMSNCLRPSGSPHVHVCTPFGIEKGPRELNCW